MMAGLLSRIFPFGNRSAGREDRTGDPDAAVLADFLKDAARPRVIDPEFSSLLTMELRWEIAADGVLDRLPLTEDQREQYDFVATCRQRGRTLYLLDSRPVWAPGIPYIPSFLLATVGEGFEGIKPLGTFDSKPEPWIFAWQGDAGAPRETD